MRLFNRGLRGFGIPRYGFYGGLRQMPLLLRRAVYTPDSVIELDKNGREIVTKLPPSPACERKHQWPPVDYSRRLPHQEPPPFGTKIIFPAITGVVPAGIDIDGILTPGVLTVPTVYTAPLLYRVEIKKFLIIPEDVDFDTIFVTILRNGTPILDIEGGTRYVDAHVPPQPSAEYGLLPCWPQDQFNTELRLNENDRIGFRVANNTPFIRRIRVAAWGWKYPRHCEDRGLRVD